MGKLTEGDEFGNRMKAYEAVETARRLDVRLPIYARIDGRSFSRFTRGMDRPFDVRMTRAMVETTKYLVGETHAIVGYTQSDEISLLWQAEGDAADVLFSGKVQKMTSVLASMAAAKFATVCPDGYRERLAHFDCRVFQLPSQIEAANAFLWRAMDARKNAVSMAAQAHFSQKALHGKGQPDMLAMLREIGVEFDDYPGFFRNGTFARRANIERPLTPDELAKIPEAHRPSGPVIRTEIKTENTVFLRDIAERVAFVFAGRSALQEPGE